jgi:hypothetical protein
MSDMPIWEKRVRAPMLTLPHWARSSPERTVYESNESGIWQVHCWDVATGIRRQVSDHPVGVLEGYATYDGMGIVFWQEETGDETGRWLVEPFTGGERRQLLEGVPVAWNEGMGQGPGIVAAGLSDRDGFAIYVSTDGGPAKEIARSTEWTVLAGTETEAPASDLAAVSADGGLLALQHAEHGDITHPALRIVDPRTGRAVGERGDGLVAGRG